RGEVESGACRPAPRRWLEQPAQRAARRGWRWWWAAGGRGAGWYRPESGRPGWWPDPDTGRSDPPLDQPGGTRNPPRPLRPPAAGRRSGSERLVSVALW